MFAYNMYFTKLNKIVNYYPVALKFEMNSSNWNLGHFGHGHFGLGRFGPDISATDVSATENAKGGRFGQKP